MIRAAGPIAPMPVCATVDRLVRIGIAATERAPIAAFRMKTRRECRPIKVPARKFVLLGFMDKAMWILFRLTHA
jgi:hypothetical protein